MRCAGAFPSLVVLGLAFAACAHHPNDAQAPAVMDALLQRIDTPAARARSPVPFLVLEQALEPAAADVAKVLGTRGADFGGATFRDADTRNLARRRNIAVLPATEYAETTGTRCEPAWAALEQRYRTRVLVQISGVALSRAGDAALVFIRAGRGCGGAETDAWFFQRTETGWTFRESVPIS